jgi:succinate dehydrogenase / fumarate reductase flavoprotein subunit
MIEVAQATMESAAARKECRGAHLVRDYEHDVNHPTCPLGRNDAEWMKHTLWYKDGNRLAYKPVRTKPLTAATVPPKPRTF